MSEFSKVISGCSSAKMSVSILLFSQKLQVINIPVMKTIHAVRCTGSSLYFDGIFMAE